MLIRLRSENIDGEAVEQTQAGHVIDSNMSKFMGCVGELLAVDLDGTYTESITIVRNDHGQRYRLTYTKED